MNFQQDISTFLLALALLALPIFVWLENEYPQVWQAPLWGIQTETIVVQCRPNNIVVLGENEEPQKTIKLKENSRACNLQPGVR